MTYKNNPLLKTVKAGWAGTPVDDRGRFMNLEYPFIPHMSDVFEWITSRNPQKQEKKQDAFRLAHQEDRSFLKSQEDCIVWLGHASFFIRLAGISMLIDPVFYDVPMVKRFAKHAFETSAFLTLNYLLISHDHRDHCQDASIRKIVAQNPGVTVLTGLNMETLLRPWCGKAPMQMAGWYQQYDTEERLQIYYLPSRHWGKRGLNDTNKRLWGAFLIRSKERTIYFSGDTGYGSHLKEVKTLFSNIDVAIVGVGAYKPEWFMGPNHVSPSDAVKAVNEMEAGVFIPMHFGTFDISDEPVGDPYRILKAEEAGGRIDGRLRILDLGECYRIG